MASIQAIRSIEPSNNLLQGKHSIDGNNDSVISLVLKFQNQATIESLIESYLDCLQSILGVKGIRYRYPLLNLSHSIGSTNQSVCNLHLKADEIFWGDLTIYRSDEFSPEEMNNLELISSLLVQPLKAAIQEKTNSIHSFDENIVGVENRNLVEQLVTREAKLSHREQVPMSIVLFDIDRFQNLIDPGNLIYRDQILYTVMKVIRSNIRDTDLLFRYENDIYCLILKGVNGKNAFSVSERVRKAIDAYNFEKNILNSSHITISSGIAELSATDSIETIFSRATNAVNHAKKLGRNQSTVADGKFIS